MRKTISCNPIFVVFLQIDEITIGSLDDIPTGPVGSFFRSIRNTLDFDFDDDNQGYPFFYSCNHFK